MFVAPEFFRDRPNMPMDPLSDLLALIEPEAVASSGLCAGGGWALECSEPDGLKFIAILEGGACLYSPDHGTYPLSAGDVVLFNGKLPHVLASEPGALAMPGCDFSELAVSDGFRRIGDGASVTLVGGGAKLNRKRGHVLHDLLPPLIHMNTLEAPGDVVGILVGRMADELRRSRLGQGLALPRLAQLVILELVRGHFDGLSADSTGWLRGISDQKIGPAIALLHSRPAFLWTVNGIAKEAGMSRTAFALRFKEATGFAPMAYLIKWRMHLAEGLLLRGDHSVAAISRIVGYSSEGAFSHAFKRERGLSPSDVTPVSSARVPDSV